MKTSIMTSICLFAFLVMQCTFLKCQVCSSGQDCPDNLPFCSSAGCVSRCPDNTLINGTYCVEHCGDNFVYGNSCVSSCPTDYQIIEEKIISISHVMYPFRYCLSQCRDWTFNYAGSCVVSCPSDSKFVDNGTCAKQCPYETKAYDLTCVKSCPQNTFDLTTKQFDIIVQACVDICPKYYLNTSCVDECPKFIAVQACVEVCPQSVKFAYENVCVSKCPNNTCLTDDNKTCSNTCAYDSSSDALVYRCPEHSPYLTMKDSQKVCVFSCEYYQVIDNFTCINITDCKRAVLSKHKCQDSCLEGELYIKIKGEIKAVYDNAYSYQLDDVNEDPCIPKFYAFSFIFNTTIFILLYGFGLVIFLSTMPCSCGKYKNKWYTGTRVKQTKKEHATGDETADHVPLLSLDEGVEEDETVV